MKQVKLWSTSLLVAMMLAIVGVTLGVVLILFPAEDRTPVFHLSLAMLLIAEAVPFAWPILNSLSSADRRSPSFVFGLGIQSVFGLYLMGVVVLGLLGHFGATEYGLVTNFMFGSDIKLVGATASGNSMSSSSTYDGFRNSQLVSRRSIDAGANDEYTIKAVVTVPLGLPPAQADCVLESVEAGTGFMISLAVSSGTSSLSVKDCVPASAGMLGFRRPSIEPTLGPLAVTLTVDGGPRQIAGSQGSYEVIYRIAIRNLSSLGSLRTLGILHAIWALFLALVLLTWRMGSQFVSRLDEQRRETSQSYSKFRSSMRVFYDNVVTDDRPGLGDFPGKLNQLNDETRYFAADTPAGLESYDFRLMADLDAMQIAYDQYINGAGDAKLVTTDLMRKLAEIAAQLKQRDNAIREAR